jgi:hypothetical protein
VPSSKRYSRAHTASPGDICLKNGAGWELDVDRGVDMQDGDEVKIAVLSLAKRVSYFLDKRVLPSAQPCGLTTPTLHLQDSSEWMQEGRPISIR